MTPINFKMISHPVNWVVVTLMLLIAGFAGHLVLSLIGLEPRTANTRSSYDEMPAGQSPGQVAAGAINPQGSAQTMVAPISSSEPMMV